MSTPVNPLDQYRSYSYQHFILCANNSEALRQLSSGQLSYSSLAALKHGQTIGNGIVMIANSTVDSVYSVDDIKLNMIYGDVASTGRSMAQLTEMDFQIREVGGATFLNFINNVLDVSMQASINNCTFLLCTFFTGHTFQGQTVQLPQSIIMPFVIVKMDSSFDYTGGIHTIKAVAANNGAAFMSISTMYLSRNLNLASNQATLGGMVKDFEKKINDQLKSQFSAVQKSTNGNGRLVQYQFNIPQEWESYKITTLAKDNFIEPLFQKQGSGKSSSPTPANPADGNAKATVNTGPKVTVLEVFNSIIKHCPQILKEFTDGAQPQNSNQPQASGGLRQIYNFQTTTTSDATSITIHIDAIVRYLPIISTPTNQNKNNPTTTTQSAAADSTSSQGVITSAINTWSGSSTSSSPAATVVNTTPNISANQQKASSIPTQDQLDSQAAQHGIVFDFIFTGANSDILSMEIKAENTNLLFQSNIASIPGAVQDAVQAAQQSPMQESNPNKNTTPLNAIRKNDGVTLPFISGEASQGYPSASPELAKASENFKNTLALLVSLSTMNSRVSIRGNPVFLEQTTGLGIPVHDNTQYAKNFQDAQAAAKQKALQLTGQFDQTKSTSFLSQDPRFIPMFCKVNLKTPIFDSTTNSVKYVNYWYQDWYQIVTIDHSFNNGDFTQQLQLLPYLSFESSSTPTTGM